MHAYETNEYRVVGAELSKFTLPLHLLSPIPGRHSILPRVCDEEIRPKEIMENYAGKFNFSIYLALYFARHAILILFHLYQALLELLFLVVSVCSFENSVRYLLLLDNGY